MGHAGLLAVHDQVVKPQLAVPVLQLFQHNIQRAGNDEVVLLEMLKALTGQGSFLASL